VVDTAKTPRRISAVGDGSLQNMIISNRDPEVDRDIEDKA
jgi:hypothetical protein